MLDHICDAIHTSRMGYPWLPVVWCVITLTHMKFVIDSPKSHLTIGYRRPLAHPVPRKSPICRAVCASRAVH